MLLRVLMTVGVCSALWLVPAAHAQVPEPSFAQGLLAGEVTQDSAYVQTRVTADTGPELNAESDLAGQEAEVRFEWTVSPPTGETPTDLHQSPWRTAIAESDFIVRYHITELEPGQKVWYRAIARPLDSQTTTSSRWCQFKTLVNDEQAGNLRFCMGSCMHYHAFMSGKPNGGGPVTATSEDKALGYPSFAAMRKAEPQFFIGTGDIVYYDHPRNEAARTVSTMRQKWHQQFRFPRLVQFFETTPAYWSKDDHDFRFDDADLEKKGNPPADTGIELFREQLPVVLQGDTESPTYRTHRVHPDLQLWFVEGRDYRSANNLPDGPQKTIWGEEQKRWLKQTLSQSDATWKIIISPTPMVGPDRASKRDNHTNPRGFRHEGESFLKWLVDNNLQETMIFCGDRHWQYHSRHPSGIEEFCCGALNDENAIRGIKPGASGSTDPEATIQQLYLYPKPSGGYLQVDLDHNGRLTITFCDDQGVVGYQTSRTP